MELRTLYYFLAVAREENITEAANVLHVTQPTLSRQIADLEWELGKQLFIRSNRSTILTEEGMHLRQRAEEILSLVSQTEEELKNDEVEINGCIRIGAGETHLMHWIAQLFSQLHQQYPAITCEFSTGNADTIEEKLEHGLFDFGVLLEPINITKYESLRLPGCDRMGIFTWQGSPWSKLDKITPEDLKNMPLLYPARYKTRNFDLVRWARGQLSADDLNIVGRNDLLGNASHLVKAQVANAFCVGDLPSQYDPGMKFIPLDPPMEIHAVVVWKKYRLLSKTSQLFLDSLKALCQQENSKKE